MADQPPASERPDHSPAIPQQVRDQIAAAEAMRADMDKENAPPPASEAEPSPPSPPRSPAGDGQPPPASDGQPPPLAEDDQSWEQRFKSLQGRYEQATRNNQTLNDRVNKLDNLVAAMQARGVEPPAATPPVAPSKPKLVTDEEIRDYGDEFMQVVGKRAREEYSPEFEQLAARLQRIETRVEGVGTVIEKNQQGEVYTTLNSQVPNWLAINRSQEFKDWLQLQDGYSGRRRQDMLLEAFSRHETDRVVRFFQGFLTEVAGTPPTSSSPGPSAPPLPGNGHASGKPSLEDFAAPGKARSGPQDLPPDKPTYTSAWIAKFMADKRTGKYRGREADADAIERDIYQAQHEGRIQ